MPTLSDSTLRLWLSHLATVRELSCKSVRSYLSGLQFHWKDLGGDLKIFKDNARIDMIIKGATRARGAAQASEGQEPLTTGLLRAAVKAVHPTATRLHYSDRMMLAAIAMGIYGVLRSGEFVITKEEAQRPEAILRLQ